MNLSPNDLEAIVVALGAAKARQAVGDLLTRTLGWKEDAAEVHAPIVLVQLRRDPRFHLLEERKGVEAHEVVVELSGQRIAPADSGPAPRQDAEVSLMHRVGEVEKGVQTLVSRLHALEMLLGGGAAARSHSVLEWLRAVDPQVQEIERVCRELSMHLGGRDFPNQGATFGTHDVHVQEVLRRWLWGLWGKPLTVVVVAAALLAAAGAVWQAAVFHERFLADEAKLHELAATATAGTGGGMKGASGVQSSSAAGACSPAPGPQTAPAALGAGAAPATAASPITSPPP